MDAWMSAIWVSKVALIGKVNNWRDSTSLVWRPSTTKSFVSSSSANLCCVRTTLTQQHHQHQPLALGKLQLRQQDQAVRLSISLGNQPFGIAAAGGEL
jgi:hypothetical protein